jgi:hypothetical protein
MAESRLGSETEAQFLDSLVAGELPNACRPLGSRPLTTGTSGLCARRTVMLSNCCLPHETGLAS